MTILLHSLAPPDRQTNRTHQLEARPIPLPICQWMAKQLVRPPTHCGVPAQQPHLLHNTATSVPTGHQTDSPYGLQAESEPLWPRDGQWTHRENKICHWRGQVSDLQGTRRHNTVLQLKEDSNSRVQTRRPGILRCIRHQNNTSISEVVILQTKTLRNRTPSGTVSLPSQVTLWNEAVVPSIQHHKVVHYSGRSNPREKATSPTATHCRQWRRRVGSRRDIR